MGRFAGQSAGTPGGRTVVVVTAGALVVDVVGRLVVVVTLGFVVVDAFGSGEASAVVIDVSTTFASAPASGDALPDADGLTAGAADR